MSTLEIQTAGDPAIIAMVFDAIAMLRAGGDIAAIIKFSALLSLIYLIGSYAFSFKANPAHLLGIIVIYNAFFLPTTTVTVNGIYTTSFASETVNNVPIGLAYIAHLSSKIGMSLAQITEQVFTPATTCPQGLQNHPTYCISLVTNLMNRVSNFATSIGGIMKGTTQETKLYTYARSNMVSIYSTCTTWDIGMNAITAGDLLTADNLWLALEPRQSATLVTSYHLADGSEILDGTCLDAYNVTTAMINNLVDSEMKVLDQEIHTRVTGGVSADLEAATQALLGVTGDAQANVRQMLAIQWLTAAIKNAGVGDSAPAQARAMAVSQGLTEQGSTLRTTGMISMHTLPVFQATMEGVIYALFPLAALMLFIPGSSFKIIHEYLLHHLWVSLLMPMYNIVNHFVTLWGVKKLGNMGTMISGEAFSAMPMGQWFNVAAMTDVYQAAAWNLMALVPVLTYFVVRGGNAIGQQVLSSFERQGNIAATHAAPASVGLDPSGGLRGLITTELLPHRNTVDGRFAVQSMGSVTGSGSLAFEQVYRGGGRSFSFGQLNSPLTEEAGRGARETFGQAKQLTQAKAQEYQQAVAVRDAIAKQGGLSNTVRDISQRSYQRADEYAFTEATKSADTEAVTAATRAAEGRNTTAAERVAVARGLSKIASLYAGASISAGASIGSRRENRSITQRSPADGTIAKAKKLAGPGEVLGEQLQSDNEQEDKGGPGIPFNLITKAGGGLVGLAASALGVSLSADAAAGIEGKLSSEDRRTREEGLTQLGSLAFEQISADERRHSLSRETGASTTERASDQLSASFQGEVQRAQQELNQHAIDFSEQEVQRAQESLQDAISIQQQAEANFRQSVNPLSYQTATRQLSNEEVSAAVIGRANDIINKTEDIKDQIEKLNSDIPEQFADADQRFANRSSNLANAGENIQDNVHDRLDAGQIASSRDIHTLQDQAAERLQRKGVNDPLSANIAFQRNNLAQFLDNNAEQRLRAFNQAPGDLPSNAISDETANRRLQGRVPTGNVLSDVARNVSSVLPEGRIADFADRLTGRDASFDNPEPNPLQAAPLTPNTQPDPDDPLPTGVRDHGASLVEALRPQANRATANNP